MTKPALTRPWWLLPLGHLPPGWWVGIAGLLIWFDCVTGPNAQFPVVYAIPVSLAAWYSGLWPALALAVALPLVHVGFLVAVWKQPGPVSTLVALTAIRGAAIIAMALWFVRLSDHERELNQPRANVGGTPVHLQLLQADSERGWRMGAFRKIRLSTIRSPVH
jgi:hypothetical protein